MRGCENEIANALSRLDSVALDAEVPAELARGVPSYACPVAEVYRLDPHTDCDALQSADATIARVIQLLNTNTRADADALEANPALKQFADVWNQLVFESALLQNCNERAISTRIVVPGPLREEVFRALHEPAHHSYEATVRQIGQRFWWPHVRSDVSTFVKACEVCDRDRNANPRPRAPLGHLPADQPFGTLYIDIVGGQGSLSLGPSPKSILTMIIGLTGWAEAVPIADQTAATVARAVYAEWIARYGVPEQLHSDRGTQFVSALFVELCASFGVDKSRTTYIARKPTVNASGSTGRSSRCFADKFSADRMTGSHCSRQCSNRTARLFLTQLAYCRPGSPLAVRCVCQSISALRFLRRRAKCARTLLSSPRTSSGPTKWGAKLSDMDTSALRSDTTSV